MSGTIGSYAELIDGEIWLRALVGRRTVRRLFAVNAAVRRKMPKNGDFAGRRATE